jgi:HK97 family phage portal protein
MGFVTRLLHGRSDNQRGAGLGEAAAWLHEAMLGPESATGVHVSPESALRYTAVLTCVRVLAEGVASLPCLLYERFEEHGREGKRRAPQHAVYRLLHDAPNPHMTALELFEVGMAHCLLWGNAYFEIEWSQGGQALALWPLAPWRVTAGMTRRAKTYRLELDGEAGRVLSDYQVLHVPGFGYDGVRGRSMISLAREAIGLGLAAERYGASVFGNGAVPGGVLEHPGALSDAAYSRLQESWATRHEGLSQAHRLAILEEGLKYNKIGIPPEDAQFLETRRFQRTEIAAVFRVPPHMIGDLERATFSNIEQQSTEYLTNTLAPWLRRWEQRINRSLLVSESERRRYFAEFLVDALLRGDTVTRYTAYATGRQWGWLSVNDIRARENMNPVAGGDEYLAPLNMQQIGDEAAGEEAPAERQADRVQRRAVDHRAAAVRLVEANRPALQDAAQRILNREANDVSNAARRLLPRSVAEFRGWLEPYLTEDREQVVRQLWPAVRALGVMAGDAAASAGADAGYDGRMEDAALEAFLRGVTAGRATGWVEKLRIGLDGVLETAPEEERAEAVTRAMQERRETEAEPWARDISTGVMYAAAVAVWSALGVLYLRWRASGAETCPYCRELDGRVVGVQEYFVPLGGEVAPAGEAPLRPHRNTRHPPLHAGCDCAVEIGG